MINHLIQLISNYGYLILFPLMIVEGPIITIAAAFLASQGILNIYIIYLLSLSGNIIGDIVYYSIGKFGREKFIKKYGKYIGVTEARVEYIENHYKKHFLKTIIIAKITEAPVVPVLISAGIAKVNFKKYLSVVSLAEIPKVFIVTLIGYYFGKFYATIGKYFKNYVAIIAIIILFLILVLLYNKFKRKKI